MLTPPKPQRTTMADRWENSRRKVLADMQNTARIAQTPPVGLNQGGPAPQQQGQDPVAQIMAALQSGQISPEQAAQALQHAGVPPEQIGQIIQQVTSAPPPQEPIAPQVPQPQAPGPQEAIQQAVQSELQAQNAGPKLELPSEYNAGGGVPMSAASLRALGY